MIRTLVEARDKNRAVDNVINRGGGKSGGKDSQSAMYWGDSEVMNNLRSIVEKVAATDANIYPYFFMFFIILFYRLFFLD